MDPSQSAPTAPPRLGGASPPLDLVEITPNALQIGALAARVVCPTAGGIATFTGTTRDHFEGKQVVRLEYEAYGAMAEKEIRAICGRMRARWALRHIAFAHRTGVVPTCEASVEIAVSSTHRKEALEAPSHYLVRGEATLAEAALKAAASLAKKNVAVVEAEAVDAVLGAAFLTASELGLPRAPEISQKSVLASSIGIAPLVRGSPDTKQQETLFDAGDALHNELPSKMRPGRGMAQRWHQRRRRHLHNHRRVQLRRHL